MFYRKSIHLWRVCCLWAILLSVHRHTPRWAVALWSLKLCEKWAQKWWAFCQGPIPIEWDVLAETNPVPLTFYSSSGLTARPPVLEQDSFHIKTLPPILFAFCNKGRLYVISNCKFALLKYMAYLISQLMRSRPDLHVLYNGEGFSQLNLPFSTENFILHFSNLAG